MFHDEMKIVILDDPEFSSGRWIDFYLQGGMKPPQDLRLNFFDGNLTGSGRDAVGAFSIRGRYDRNLKEVMWRKIYVRAHTVFYRGFREII
ncbi:MAG: hypothetical protein ACI97A_003320 [Planctomycetota bacterium]|jgi:hypothetical protein